MGIAYILLYFGRLGGGSGSGCITNFNFFGLEVKSRMSMLSLGKVDIYVYP